jgi:phage terminase small subunit
MYAAQLDRRAMRITPKQEAFALAYCRLMNASDAYREVYNIEKSTSKSIAEMASRLLKDVKVASRISEIRATAEKATILDMERTRTELARVCFSDIRRLCNADGSFKEIRELDDNTAAAIASIEIKESKVDGVVVRRTIKVKLCDKIAALEMAMKHLGLFEHDYTQRAKNMQIQVLLVE